MTVTTLDDIFATAQSYTGAERHRQPILRQFCAAEQQRLEDQLLEGVTVEDCYESFTCAAGLLAAADYSAAFADDGISAFTVGPISVTRQDEARARTLRRQAATIMSPWCRSPFRFLGVRG